MLVKKLSGDKMRGTRHAFLLRRLLEKIQDFVVKIASGFKTKVVLNFFSSLSLSLQRRLDIWLVNLILELFLNFVGIDLVFLLQECLSLPVLQYMPHRKGSRHRLFSLHDLQLLSLYKIVEPQVQGELPRTQLPALRRVLIHINHTCQSSTLWPFYSFDLLQGNYIYLNILVPFTFPIWHLSVSISLSLSPSLSLLFELYLTPCAIIFCQACEPSPYRCLVCNQSSGDRMVRELINSNDAIFHL